MWGDAGVVDELDGHLARRGGQLGLVEGERPAGVGGEGQVRATLHRRLLMGRGVLGGRVVAGVVVVASAGSHSHGKGENGEEK